MSCLVVQLQKLPLGDSSDVFKPSLLRPLTQAPEQNSRCNKDTCGNNSSALKFTQTVSLSRPSDWPWLPAASLCLITTLLLYRLTTTSEQPASIHCPFTDKRDTDKLLLCSFTTLRTQKTSIHCLIRKLALSVCDLTDPSVV